MTNKPEPDALWIKHGKDGQSWLIADAGGGRTCMMNLNNLFLDMHREGINRGICLDALRRAQGIAND